VEYTGLGIIGTRYKLNRELTEEERNFQLHQKRRLELNPVYELCVVRMNGTFLESVDRFYRWRGFQLVVAVPSLVIFTYFYLLMMNTSMSGYPEAVRHVSMSESLWFMAYLNGMALPTIGFLVWMALQESFTYTHFPIRLNRKNRKVYVFRPARPNKPILVADWDKLFFTLGRCNSRQEWDIRAHVLADDRKTVLDTFSFSYFSTSQDRVRAHWEFLRRYMEDGPQEAFQQVEVCMPIAEHRETLRFSLNRFYVNFVGAFSLWLGMLPIWLACILGRWLAGLTCRTPVWPADIEAACHIEPNDPFVKDEHMNPADMWVF
jgi:hypothetical protein